LINSTSTRSAETITVAVFVSDPNNAKIDRFLKSSTA
jgi:hypothetical protein